MAGLSEDETPPDPSAPTEIPTFDALYLEYFQFVWSCARRLGIETSGMDDFVQEVFLVIHAKLGTLENRRALRSWIYGIVRRTASNHRRAQRLSAGSGASEIQEALSREPTPLEQTERNADLQLLMTLLNELDESKREIFALVEVEELTVPEASEVLGIPLNTAYSRLRAARQSFDAAVARHDARANRT